MAHKELGYRVLDKLKAELGHIADVDSEPVSDRNLLSMVVTPKKDIDRILAKDAKPAETAVPETLEPAAVAETAPESSQENES